MPKAPEAAPPKPTAVKAKKATTKKVQAAPASNKGKEQVKGKGKGKGVEQPKGKVKAKGKKTEEGPSSKEKVHEDSDAEDEDAPLDEETQQYLKEYLKEMNDIQADLQAHLAQATTEANDTAQLADRLKEQVAQEAENFQSMVRTLKTLFGPEFTEHVLAVADDPAFLEELSSGYDEADARQIAEYLTSAFLRDDDSSVDYKGKKRMRPEEDEVTREYKKVQYETYWQEYFEDYDSAEDSQDSNFQILESPEFSDASSIGVQSDISEGGYLSSATESEDGPYVTLFRPPQRPSQDPTAQGSPAPGRGTRTRAGKQKQVEDEKLAESRAWAEHAARISQVAAFEFEASQKHFDPVPLPVPTVVESGDSGAADGISVSFYSDSLQPNMQQATSSNATGGSPVELLDCCSRVQQQRSVTSIDLSFWGSIKGLFSAPESSVNLYLSRANLSCTVGADPTVSTIFLPGSGISPCHCTISWDGDNADSVKLQNNSTDDSLTINGDPAVRGKPYSLRDGDMICFPNSDGAFNASAVGKVGDYMPPAFDDEYFEDKKDLASGAQGKVSKIVKRATDKLYAMKTIKTSGRPGIHSMTMYRAAQEIDIMKRMQHPAICQVYECFINPHSITVVMDYMNGGDLSKYLLKEATQCEPHDVDEPRAKDISFQIFGALAYIHSRGIVHADVKPQNIVLTRDAPPTVKLCDFGLSGAVCSHQNIMHSRGTKPYMAPEVLDTDLYRGFDVKADCWSMGVTMFFMLSGKGIYGGPYDVYDPSRAVNWDCISQSDSEQVKDLIQHLLNPSPSRRISASESLHHAWFVAEPPAPDSTHISAEASLSPLKNESIKKMFKGRQSRSDKSKARKTPSCRHCGKKYLHVKDTVREAAEKVHKKKNKTVIQ
ncbi:hypothetical protein D9613_009399 [Agrocybe pediades]|uniref:non-specific serine/threonine protein kinase n=1 Tax=Agrocybe pediades TaxID=84607 RepID=A0A8H4R352_9AGAR|nr:hypothetical protein D9613_009399 [Agrocybe pediades]